MDDKDWLIIRTVYELKNVTRAAQLLNTSQPALSYRLKQIEKKLDVQLFDMSHKSLTFTLQGEQIAHYAVKVLQDYRDMKENLQQCGDRLRGEIRIGASSNYAAYRLPKLLQYFIAQHPQVAVNVTTGLSLEIFHQLQRNDVHLALVKDDLNWKEGKHMVDENYFFIVYHRPVDLADLPHLPQIRISHGPYISTLLDRWWNASFSAPPRVAMTVDKLEVCLEMVKHGLGYAILSNYLPFDAALHPCPIFDEDNKPITNHTWLLYRHHALHTPRLARFIQLLSAPAPAATGCATWQFASDGS
ncbi:LysR family transcriptional regulator [Sodalis sp. C49]|uniref:LysR family transcriptional regulator n=1 Tax=unclassified Sodalis (in: enterobacteria) TaxID=2636512 RepID=UPI003965B21B